MIPGQLFKVKAEVHWFLWNKVNRYAESMRTAVPSNTVLEHIGKFYDSGTHLLFWIPQMEKHLHLIES